jgi:phage-related protein
LNCCRDLNTSQAQSQNFSQNLSQSSASSQRTSYNDFFNLSQVSPIAEFINLVKVCFIYAQTCFEFFYAQIKYTYCIIIYFMCIICVRIHTASLFEKQLNSIITSLDDIMRVAQNVRRLYAHTCFEFFYAQIKYTYCIIIYFMCIICVRIHTASLFEKQLNSIITSLDDIMRVAQNVRRQQCQMVLAIDAHAGVMLNLHLFQQC